MLGNHDDIVSVGELRRLKDHYNGNLACTCDVAVDQCEFWAEVDAEHHATSASLGTLETLLPRSSSLLADLVYFLPARLLN